MKTPKFLHIIIQISHHLGLNITRLAFLLYLLNLPLLSHQLFGQEKSPSGDHSSSDIVLQLKWLHQFNFAGYYAAVDQGYYAEAGLDVVIKEGQPGMNFIDEVVSGRANYGVEMPELLIAHSQGKPVVVLAAIYQHSPQIMLSRTDSQIKSPHDLIGKRVMWRFDSAAELRAMLASEKVSLDQINFMELSWDIKDLIEGRVDAIHAYITDQPFQLESAGVESSVLQPINYGVDFYGDCLFTSNKELFEHPQRVKAFREASLRGWAYAMAHPEEMMAIIRDQYHAQVTLEFMAHEFEHMDELMLPKLVEIGHMNPGRWQAIGDNFVKLGMLDPDYTLDGFLYDPNPKQDMNNVVKIIWVLIFVLAGISTASIGLIIFNRRLNRKVLERTKHLSNEIAEREQAEKSLHQTETQFRLLAENARDMIYRMSIPDGNYEYVSLAAEQIFGYTAEDFINSPLLIREVIHPDWNDYFKEQWDLVLAGKISPIYEYQIVHGKSGEVRWLHQRNFLVKNDQGQPIAIEGIVTDFTERKQGERSLILVKESLEQAQAIANIGSWEMDAITKNLTWSKQMFQILEVNPDQEPSFDLYFSRVHPDDIAYVQEVGARVYEENEAAKAEYRLMMPSGSIKFVATEGHRQFEGDEVVKLTGIIQDITVRKEAENQLRQSSQLLEASQSIAKVGGWELDIPSSHLYWTAETYRIHETSPDAFDPNVDAAVDFYLPESRKIISKAVDDAIETGKDFDLELELQTLKGNKIDVRATCEVTLHEGKPVKLTGIFQDITEYKRTAIQLKESEELLSKTSKLSKIGGWSLDASTGISYWTEETYRIFEVDFNKEAPKLPEGINFYTPQSRPFISKAVDLALKTGTPYDLELEIITTKNNRRWIRTLGSADRKDDKIVSISGTIQDITDRKEADRKLQKNKKELELALQGAEAGLWSWNIDTGEDLLDERWCRILGYRKDEVKQHVSTWENFIHPDDKDRIMDVVQKHFEDEKNEYNHEYRMKCKNGKWKWIHAIGKVVERDSDGNPYRMTGIIIDINARKEAEEEIRKHRDHLEELVGERTSMLQQQNLELTDQRAEIEEANRLKSEFLANMSHELRTPLNAIMSLSNVLARGAKDRLTDEESHYLEIVERNGGDLLELINDILDLSKIESGKSEIVLSDISVGHLLDTVKDTLTAQAQEKKLELDLIVPENFPLITTDESKLFQVFTNVISNAVKFTESGSVNIIVKSDTKSVHVEIKDTGIGISEAELPHIFDQFRQGDGTYSRKYEGTGLGLAIAYKTMSMLGGKILVKSKLGIGSVFTIIIPIIWAGDKATVFKQEKPEPKPSRKKKKAQPKTGLMNILVVEDNPDNMITVKALLKGKYNILESVDGKHGLAQAIEKLPDLILLDMVLPEMSGTEVVKILKSKKETQNIPVIALTASVMPHNQDSFLRAGCDAILAKPIERDILLDSIEKWLEQ